MHLLSSLVSVALFSLVSARNLPRDQLEARDDVSNCKAILVALKASAFCSSFVPIKDVTTTSTAAGPSTLIVTTVPGDCELQKRSATTKPTTTSKTTTTPKTTLAAAKSTPKTTATSTSPSTTSGTKCNAGNVQLNVFACDVIKAACVAFVKPKTTTVTTQVPGITSVSTYTSVCPTPTDPPVTVSPNPTTDAPVVTTTGDSSPPVCITNGNSCLASSMCCSGNCSSDGFCQAAVA